jgi:hypothetical protein
VRKKEKRNGNLDPSIEPFMNPAHPNNAMEHQAISLHKKVFNAKGKISFICNNNFLRH